MFKSVLRTLTKPRILPINHHFHTSSILLSTQRLPSPPASNFNISENHIDLAKVLKPTTPNDLYVSCTIFDIKGNVTAVSQRFPKMKFLQEHGLYPRDLRKIDTSAIDVVPSILIRNNGFLVNLLHIKALVEHDKVMIFDTSDPSSASRLGLFVYDLEAKLKVASTGSWIQQYEHKALESILINVMTCLETELHHHLEVSGIILAELEDQIDRDKLRELLIKSKALSAFYQKAFLIKEVLEELLENEDDLMGMYLTDKVSGRKLTEKELEEREDFGEVEMLLEAYYKQCDEFVQQAGSLISNIKSTEEIVNIILDANRNSLMLFELKVTIYTLGFTVATLLPAFYGMNLKNFIEESYFGFGSVVLISFIVGFYVTARNFRSLRSVQRLTLLPSNQSLKRKAVTAHQNFRKKKFWSCFKTVRNDTDERRYGSWKWLVEKKK